MRERVPVLPKNENRDVRNLEDVWEVLSRDDLDKLKETAKKAWSFVARSYISLLAFVAVLPILTVIGAVYFHFQLGGDVPWLSVKSYTTAAHWGQIGDFIGGVLNPLLSFVAFIAVLINLVLQRRDLALAREEARESNRTQRMQSRIFQKQNEAVERQNFESTFFRLLEAHSQQFKLARVSVPNSVKDKVGEDCFAWVTYKFLPAATYGVDPVELLRQNVNVYAYDYSIGLSRYFKNLHQILKFIDGYGSRSTLSEGMPSTMRVRKAIRYYSEQRVYANILRAQLSNDELCCIFINCLTDKGAGLRHYVEKYSILKGVELPEPFDFGYVKSVYDDMAYADSEDITKEQLRKVVSEKYDVSQTNEDEF